MSAFESPSTMDSLVEELSRLDVDSEWLDLHAKIVLFRSQHQITISNFLRVCELNPNKAYFKQLCTSTGCKLRPSRRNRFVGREFRDKVAAMFDKEFESLRTSAEDRNASFTPGNY